MNWDVVYAVGLVFGLFTILYYLIPFLRDKKLDYYKEVKFALMLFSYAFRYDKVKRIADLALEIVKSIEELSLSPEEKRIEALTIISQRLLNEFNIVIDDDALGLIIDIAVTLLPPTNKG